MKLSLEAACISVYRNLASCESILSFSFMWITKLPKLKSPYYLGSSSSNISSCCSGNKVARSILMLLGTSPSIFCPRRAFKQCQCLFWFYWLVHAISHEITDCIICSWLCSFALTSKSLCGITQACMVSEKNSSHFILVKLTS